jgi:hypothetical protein
VLGLVALALGCGGDDSDGGPDGAPLDSAADTKGDVTVDASDASDASDGGANDAPADAPIDAPIDANLSPISQQILAVRNAAGGSALSLPIDGAIVTYVKPLVGSEPAGFFVQGDATGLAIFVAVDPATLTPMPVAGDQVSFTVTAASSVSGLREVTALTAFTRTAQNVPLAPRDVSSATDLVSSLDAYESEYITLNATVESSFGQVQPAFVQAQIQTTGLTGNGALNLRLRAPQTVKSATGLDAACTVTLTGIMMRFGGVAQPSGWVSGDFAGVSCNAPKVQSAVATSDTSVVVTFDRDIDGATLALGGGQFAFDNGLTASAASVAASNQIAVTTASQGMNKTYDVTVDASLKDTLGKGVDGAANTAKFTSFNSVAVLQLNEVSPNITGSLDLVELLALSGGRTTGITVVQNISSPTVLATLPNITVAPGDLIVVHLGATTATSETTTRADCGDPSCYPGAWDVKGTTTGITYSGRVLVVRAPDTTIQDGAAFYTSTPPAGFAADVMSLQAAGAWLPADCAGNPCNTNTLAEGVSVSWTGVGSTATGASVSRKANADTNFAADWAVGPSTFGSSNP